MNNSSKIDQAIQKQLAGTINARTSCKRCGNVEITLNEKYDSYYCAKCNVWLEPRCNDERCQYCRTRPDKPNEQ